VEQSFSGKALLLMNAKERSELIARWGQNEEQRRNRRTSTKVMRVLRVSLARFENLSPTRFQALLIERLEKFRGGDRKGKEKENKGS